MKTTNHGFGNLSAWLLVGCSSAFLLVLAGCPLQSFSRLEEEALKNGTISVGAVRVMNYKDPCLIASRQRLINALYAMEANLTDANIMPQSYMSNENFFKLNMALNLNLAMLSAKADPNKTLAPLVMQDLNGPTGAFYDIFKGQEPRPSEIEMVGLRMAARKFIESEIEDLNLTNVYPVDCNYKRCVISLDLTAWVRGDAKAALVYVDLYPFKADDWCHKEANTVCSLNSDSNMWDSNDKINWNANNIKWNGKLSILGEGFYGNSLNNLTPPELTRKDGISNYIARLHGWLKRNHLCPRIVQVERMNPGEYSILANRDYEELGLQVSATHPAGVSAQIDAERAKKMNQFKAEVQQFNLAFVAGDLRAGWLFMPIKGLMRPTERKLRIVVDIPVHMKKLGVYVHKIFLDASLHPITQNTDFASQMDSLKQTRSLLTKTDKFYDDEQWNQEPMFYPLIKTRIRNLLYQGWSEEIVADIPYLIDTQ